MVCSGNKYWDTTLSVCVACPGGSTVSADGLSCTCGGPSSGPGQQYWNGAACVTCGGPSEHWDTTTLTCITCTPPNNKWCVSTSSCGTSAGPGPC